MGTAVKSFKLILYVLGGVATAVFVMSKNDAAVAWATAGDYLYGDLYALAKIGKFKPPEPLRGEATKFSDSIDKGQREAVAADSILLGDSFSFCDRGDGSFEKQLQKRAGTPLFGVYNNHHKAMWADPYLAIGSQTNPSASQRIFVYEVVERSIEQQFHNPPNMARPAPANGPFSRIWRQINKSVFDDSEPRTEMLLKHNPVTSPIIGLWNTAVFGVFGEMPGETPLYSIDPPFLFYRDEVACFESEHDDQLVARIAENIAGLDRVLRDTFGCALVFVPVPNKITVYSRFATRRPYDEFLPRLCSALRHRGVRTVELLPRFEKEKRLLYSQADTHWNELGIHIAVEETLKDWPGAVAP